MKDMTYTVTKQSITLILEGETHTVQRGAANFLPLREAILNEDWEAVPGLLTVASGIEAWAKGDFIVKDKQVYYKDEPFPEELNQRVIQMATKDEDPTPMFNFWERLQKNPSFRSVQQLYGFLKHEGIPIEPDGTFLAYKSVRKDYKDHHSGMVDNSVGTKHEMPRNKISDDPNYACHFGFHIGALEYAETFHSGNQRIVICRIDPEDVVCVPYDSSQRKMRVCRYEVIGHHAVKLPSTTYSDAVTSKGKKTKKGEKKAKADYRLPEKRYKEIDGMDETELMELSLSVLRKYAAHHLNIVGACKIPGGKLALIDTILTVRSQTSK